MGRMVRKGTDMVVMDMGMGRGTLRMLSTLSIHNMLSMLNILNILSTPSTGIVKGMDMGTGTGMGCRTGTLSPSPRLSLNPLSIPTDMGLIRRIRTPT